MSQGCFSKLLLENGSAPHVFDSGSTALEYLQESMRKYGRHVGGHGIRGTRSRPSERTRISSYSVYGTVVMNISPADFVDLLPPILGGTASGTTFPLAETLPAFGLLFDRDYNTFEYLSCKINRAILEGERPFEDGAWELQERAEPDILRLTLEIIAEDERRGTAWPDPAPSLSLTSPFVFPDAVVTMLSSARQMKKFRLVVDNMLYARFVNSLTATSIVPRDREVTFSCIVPWESAVNDLYGQALAGAAANIKFTNGAVSTTFTFGTLQVPDYSPTVERGKTEIDLVLSGTARSISTTAELSVDNDSTP